MDLAQHLVQWRDWSPDEWIARANRLLPSIAVVALVVLIAFQAAPLTWQLLESPADQDLVSSVIPVAVSGDRAGGPAASSLYAIVDKHLMGEAPEADAGIPAEAVLDAPDTTLNVTLHGILVHQPEPEPGTTFTPDTGWATIAAPRGDQISYWNGDEIQDIPNGTASLYAVFTDYVLLDRGGGRYERLRIMSYLDGQAAGGGRQLNSRVTARRPATQPQQQSLSGAAQVAAAVGNVANVLGQHMTITMHEVDGRMIGFRLQPRNNSQVFEQLGLEPGDVLTEVNGIRLESVSNTAEVLRALSESPQANVTIRRNSVDQAIVMDVARIQQIAESLQ